ncbi:MAG: hypothetical protein PHD95_02595 [Candidatus ainarchaeum sp.]|nr:hypothetical protein [Candidatus ainarchaeum sp.]
MSDAINALTSKGLNTSDADMVVRKLHTRHIGPQRALLFLMQHATPEELRKIAQQGQTMGKQRTPITQPHQSLANFVLHMALGKISQLHASQSGAGKFYKSLQEGIASKLGFVDITPLVTDRLRPRHNPALFQTFIRLERELLLHEKTGRLLTPEGITAQERFWKFVQQSIKE